MYWSFSWALQMGVVHHVLALKSVKGPRSFCVELLIGILMCSPTQMHLLLGPTGADKGRALDRYIRSRLQIVAVLLLLLLLLMSIHIRIVLLPGV